MLYTPLDAENALGIAERRVRTRLHPISLIFINLDDLNGGVVFNISEDGLALSAAMILPDGHLPTMRIQFPGSSDWTVASGQIVWKSKSKKEAGVRFVDLTEEARRQIRSWIASEAAPGESRQEASAPSIGMTEEARQRMKGGIFREELRGASRLDSKTAQEGQHSWRAGRNEAAKSSILESLNLGAVTEKRIGNVNIITPSGASPNETESLAAKPALPRARDLSRGLPHPVASSSAPDRRAHPRTRIIPLGLMQLGENNGGIALNISEGGLAITAAVILAEDDLPSLRFQFPDSGNWIETSGQIAWRSESKKEAGVRFVGLTEEAQQQIRNWISSQVLGGESCPERETPPVLLNQQDALGGVDAHTPNSPVSGAESSGAAAEQLIQSMDISPAAQTSLNKTPEVNAEPTVPQRRFISGDLDGQGNAPPISNRRVHLRKPVVPPGYIDLAKNNGGIVLNVSESGLSLMAAVAVGNDPFPSMRFQFPYCSDWIEARGQVAWKSESGTHVGVRFVELSEDARQQIRKWISSEALSSGVQEQIEKIRQAQNLRVESLILGSPAPGEVVQKNSQAGHLLPDAISNPQEVKVPVSASTAPQPGGIPSDEGVLKVRWRAKDRRRNLGARGRTWGRMATITGLIGLITLTVGGIVRNRDVGNKMIAVVAWKTGVTSGAVKSETHPLESRIASAPTPSVGKMDLQARGEESLPAEKHQSPGTSPINSPRQVRSAERPSASIIPKPQNRPSENASTPGKQIKEPPLAAAIVNRPSVQIAERQRVGSLPATPPQLEPNMVSPVNLDSGLPRGALPVEVKKESSPSPPKPAETPVNITGLVAMRTDPYPSLRIPTELGSKKSPRGASLQLGHLVTRVEPAYPEEAKERGIEGTVKLHAIFGRDGAVKGLSLISGPALLVPAAMNAVREWHYSQTILDSQSVEIEEDIAVVFRLSNSAATKN
jgi:outer membrane biosynthesis protein TonB